MARLNYGFNLGQIEGLDSSVKTVTLTIANATKTNTYTLKYSSENGDYGWTDSGSVVDYTIALYKNDDDVFDLYKTNFSGSDLGDIYNVTISTSAVEENFKSAVETVLVDNGLIGEPETLFDGTITITAEDVQGVEIPFDMDVSSYPFEKWTVTINGLEIPYQEDANGFVLEVDNIGYGVFDNNGVRMLSVVNIQDESYPPVPGDYQVKIVGISESGSSGTNLPPIDTSTNYGDYNISVNRFGEISYKAVQLPRITPSSGNKMYIPACVGGIVDYLNDINGIDLSIMYSPCAYMLTYSASASPNWQLHSINVPTTAGNYVLKATVGSGGVVSFSFVSE